MEREFRTQVRFPVSGEGVVYLRQSCEFPAQIWLISVRLYAALPARSFSHVAIVAIAVALARSENLRFGGVRRSSEGLYYWIEAYITTWSINSELSIYSQPIIILGQWICSVSIATSNCGRSPDADNIGHVFARHLRYG